MVKAENTQGQGKMQGPGITKVKEIIEQKSINSLSANMKKARAKLNQLSDRLQQKIKQIELAKAAAAEAKKEEVKPQVVALKVEPKPVMQQPEQKKVAPASPAQNQSRNFADRKPGGYQQGSFRDRNNQAQGDRPRQPGQFGSRPNGQFANKPNGQFGPRPNGQFGQKPAGGFGSKPMGQRLGTISNADKLDASTLIKPNSATNHAQTKKKAFDNKSDDKKSMNKKALVMRGYVEDDSLFDDESFSKEEFSLLEESFIVEEFSILDDS